MIDECTAIYPRPDQLTVLREAYYLIDQLDCLAVEKYPLLYAEAQKWKVQAKLLYAESLIRGVRP